MTSPLLKRSAFTLVEIMIVIGIIGLLAALSVPMHSRLKRKTVSTTFHNDLKTICDAINLHAMEKGRLPADGGGGLHEDLREYLGSSIDPTKRTPIGGTWVWVLGGDGTSGSLEVRNHTVHTDQLENIDSLIDDGNLGTGLLVTSGQTVKFAVRQ